MYEWLVFGHVVGAIVWVGAGVTGAVLMMRMAGADLAEKRTILTAMQKVGVVFPIASLLVIGLGVWMVIDAPAIGFGDTWIVVAYAGIGLSGLVQALVDPNLKRLATELEAGDPAAHDRWRLVSRIVPLDAAILLIVVWAMVTKPG